MLSVLVKPFPGTEIEIVLFISASNSLAIYQILAGRNGTVCLRAKNCLKTSKMLALWQLSGVLGDEYEGFVPLTQITCLL